MLKPAICRRFSVLDETGRDQRVPRRSRIFNEQIKVAERTVGWNRIVGGDLRTLHEHQGAAIRGTGLTKNETREHRAQSSGTRFSPEIGWNVAPSRSPELGSRKMQMMLP